MDIKFLAAFIAALVTSLLITPLVIKFALKIGATDKPNHRKVHSKIMPRLGGLAVFAGVIAGYFVGGLYNEKITGITVGAIIIVITGVLDDKYELSAKYKLIGQLLAAAALRKQLDPETI